MPPAVFYNGAGRWQNEDKLKGIGSIYNTKQKTRYLSAYPWCMSSIEARKKFQKTRKKKKFIYDVFFMDSIWPFPFLKN